MATEWEQTVHSAYTGATLRLVPAGVMYILQDAVTGLHAKGKCGNKELREQHGCFWVITKSKAEIRRYPAWCETITVRATSLDAGRIRTIIKVDILDAQGNLCASAVQEMCVLDFERHRPQKLSSVGFFPEQDGEEICFEKFETEGLAPHHDVTVPPHMIDMSGHLNNVEYVKLALDCFENPAVTKREIAALETHHLRECREGETLTVACKNEGETSQVCLFREGEPVFEMKILWREKK